MPPRDKISLTDGVTRPKLIVTVDTEEEFDWRQPFSRNAVSVRHMKSQRKGQEIFERYGVRPTYLVDYAIASNERGFRELAEWFADGRCELGTHLHPWINPPFDEEVSAYNSYAGNLPYEVERAKLTRLTDIIEENLRCRSRVYRAGRYGIGPMTPAILDDLGYEIDTSIVPFTDFTSDGGPDFTASPADPFWFGPGRGLLEIPLTVGWCGQLRAHGDILQRKLFSDVGMKLHVPGVFARLGLLERIRLTPEGTVFADMKRLVDTLLTMGTRTFVLSYHSPSLEPGNTPYVRDAAELEAFLARIDRFCDYFVGACGGVASSLQDVRLSLMADV